MWTDENWKWLYEWENKLISSASAPASCIILGFRDHPQDYCDEGRVSSKCNSPGLKVCTRGSGILVFIPKWRTDTWVLIFSPHAYRYSSVVSSFLLVDDFHAKLKCEWILLCISKPRFQRNFNSCHLEKGGLDPYKKCSMGVSVPPQWAMGNCIKKTGREDQENPSKLSFPNCLNMSVHKKVRD